ncbi:MAG: phosphoribosylanthranilate isomerase [candidate division WOR-3 bacterium]
MGTKIKICGITNVKDAMISAEYGADAIGFIFASSMRMISPEKAKEIIKKIPRTVKTVGVFKDAPVKDVNEIVKFTGIDGVQLHGSESPEYCRLIRNAFVIKRLKIDNDTNYENIEAEIKKYNVSAYLFDPGEGSGKVFEWNLLKGVKGPIIVAGGLNADNVKDVIRLLSPYGVDICSGVEKEIGKKDPLKIKRFIQEVRRCSSPV